MTVVRDHLPLELAMQVVARRDDVELEPRLIN
jgi:hypothetical protein